MIKRLWKLSVLVIMESLTGEAEEILALYEYDKTFFSLNNFVLYFDFFFYFYFFYQKSASTDLVSLDSLKTNLTQR